MNMIEETKKNLQTKDRLTDRGYQIGKRYTDTHAKRKIGKSRAKERQTDKEKQSDKHADRQTDGNNWTGMNEDGPTGR